MYYRTADNTLAVYARFSSSLMVEVLFISPFVSWSFPYGERFVSFVATR